MAGPYTISVVADVAQASTESILRDQRGRTLAEPSRIKCYANRETVEVSFNSTVGADEVTSDAGAAINTTDGDGPIVPDDLLFDTFGFQGDEIVIRARNTAAAAAREARLLVFVIPVSDDVLQRAMNSMV